MAKVWLSLSLSRSLSLFLTPEVEEELAVNAFVAVLCKSYCSLLLWSGVNSMPILYGLSRTGWLGAHSVDFGEREREREKRKKQSAAYYSCRRQWKRKEGKRRRQGATSNSCPQKNLREEQNTEGWLFKWINANSVQMEIRVQMCLRAKGSRVEQASPLTCVTFSARLTTSPSLNEVSPTIHPGLVGWYNDRTGRGKWR